MNLTEKLKNYIDTINISEYGFADISGIKTGELLENEPSAKNLHTGISIVIKLSPAVLEGISDKPTHSYFHHYRTVNAHIDASLLKIGMFLDSHGYRYYPIPASQSINGFQGTVTSIPQMLKTIPICSLVILFKPAFSFCKHSKVKIFWRLSDITCFKALKLLQIKPQLCFS